MELNTSSVKRIVIIGPESTGKSTLCTQLANYYNTIWCPEYAREYLLQHGKNYSYNDLLSIAHGQIALEDEYLASVAKNGADPKFLFIDTDMYVMKVWCEYVFNDCHHWILNQIATRPYHLYLLCRPDLPWVQDELREYPDEKPRQELFHIYRELMTEQQTPWAEVYGNDAQRLQHAIAAVEHHIIGKPQTL